MRIWLRVCFCTRAVELDRARAVIEPLRIRSQRFYSCVSLSGVSIHGMSCLSHMSFMQIMCSYAEWGASGQRASPEGSTDKPTVASSRSKRRTSYSYNNFE